VKQIINVLIVLFLIATVELSHALQFQTYNNTQKSTYTLTSHDLGITPKLERKDTRMLCLEGCPLHGPNAWDKPHENFSNHSSTRGIEAVISMVASYYGGNLSQDRIAYHVYAEYFNDSIPENDLGHGKGIIELNLVFVLEWALNGASVLRQNGKPDFDEIKYRLDTNRPILRDDGSIEHRITLIDGYTLEGELVHVIDPLTGTESKVPYENLSIFVIWFPYAEAITARSDEPTIWKDSDGDGIVDFDEINRFHTDPLNSDTDGDGIDDKTEIRSYTFLNNDTFDSKDIRKPDPDEDGLRAELDPDSDNGGLPDGLEDLNRNGKVDQGETDPLDPSDDTQTNPIPEDTFGKWMPWIVIVLVSSIIVAAASIIYFKHAKLKENHMRKHKK
jgi:hypothetical protein